jgi:Synergist-CTERM protein sorting domain-containing protein
LKSKTKRRSILLLALVALLAMGNTVWADFNDYVLKDIALEGVRVRNEADEDIGKSEKAVASFDISNKSGKSTMTLYYAHGASYDKTLADKKAEVKKLDFNMTYGLSGRQGTSPSDITVQWSSNAINAAGFAASKQCVIKKGENEFHIKDAYVVVPAVSSGNVKLEINDTRQLSNETTIATPVLIDVSAGAIAHGSGNGVMYVGSLYGQVLENPGQVFPQVNQLLPAADIEVSISGPNGYKWVMESVSVEPKEKNGIRASVKHADTTLSQNKFSKVAVIEFTGQPLTSDKTDFIVTGDVVDGNNKVVLKGVSKLISVKPEATSDLVALTRDPDGKTLSFPDSSPRTVEVYFKNGLVAPKQGFLNNDVKDHNLCDIYGGSVFKTNAVSADYLGLRVTRVLGSTKGSGDMDKLTYTFIGTPAATFDLYPKGKFADGTPYMLNPITIVKGRVNPGQQLGLSKSSLSRTVGEWATATEKVTTIPSDARITGVKIGETEAIAAAVTASAPTEWNGLAITWNDTSITVNKAASDAAIANQKTSLWVSVRFNGVTKKDIELPLQVTDNSAPILSIAPASPSVVTYDHGQANVTSIDVTATLGGSVVPVLLDQVAPNTYNGLNIEIEGDSTIRVSGTASNMTSEVISSDITVIGYAGHPGAGKQLAVPVKFSIRIKPSLEPAIIVEAPGYIDISLGSTAQKSLRLSASNSGKLTIDSLASANGNYVKNNMLVREWNGLTVTAGNNSIAVAVTGMPKIGTETFTLTGRIDGKEVEDAAFDIRVTDPSITDYFAPISRWTKQFTRSADSLTVNIPVTKAFVDAFGKNGAIETADIAKVTATVSGNPAAPLDTPRNGHEFRISGNAVSGYILHITLNFKPYDKKADWYSRIALTSLAITGKNGRSVSQSLDGASFGAIPDVKKNSHGGGCDSGLGLSALLCLTPFILRRKDS